MASAVRPDDRPQQIADRLIRRSKISKMTRALQDRLALANIRIQGGSTDSDSDREMKRKRSHSNVDLFSDTSSVVSGYPASSPLGGMFYSSQIMSTGQLPQPKKLRSTSSFIHPSQTQHRRKTRTMPLKESWKTAHHLPQSSPTAYRTVQRPSLHGMPHLSFVSETSTIMNSPSASEDDDQDLPIHSFHVFSEPAHIPSSPPRTPSPDGMRNSTLHGKHFTPLIDESFGGREGADLLLYLATSPSPAMPLPKSSPVMMPSTPPMKHTPLPSSMMHTPGNQAFFGFGNTTPNTAFNFSEFVNVTPSPAQRRWHATPIVKTPMTNSRRRDNLMPPPAMSPNLLRTPMRREGLGMELGGELRRF